MYRNEVPVADPAALAADAARYAPIPSDVVGFSGARIGASRNQLSTDEPLVFDRSVWDTASMWSPERPSQLTIPDNGFYSVTAQVTVLGSGYPESPSSPNVEVRVHRNSDLTDLVCVDRLTQQEPTVALHVSCATSDWFLADDFLEVYVTPNRTVESNWPGRGNVSPLLIVVRLD